MEPKAAKVTGSNSAPRAVWRFSIRHILIWTAAIGLACVALRNASAMWVGLAQAAALLILATAILLVIFRRGAAQAYWIGFALFGGLYMLLLLVGWLGWLAVETWRALGRTTGIQRSFLLALSIAYVALFVTYQATTVFWLGFNWVYLGLVRAGSVKLKV